MVDHAHVRQPNKIVSTILVSMYARLWHLNVIENEL